MRAAQRADSGSDLPAWAAAALALLLLLLWSRRPEPVWLAASAFAVATSAWLGWRRPDQTLRGLLTTGLALLLVGVVMGLVTQSRLSRIEADWPAEQSRRTQQLAGRLGREVSRLDGQGRVAAAAAGAVAESGTPAATALNDVLERTEVDAVMVFTADGDLIAWAGEHRGPIPQAVRNGEPTAYFEAQPLYSYLYFTTAVKATGHHAVSAVLLETAAPREGAARAISFAARTDMPAQFRSGGASGEDVAWSLVVDGDTVVHARVDAPLQADVSQESSTRAARVVFGLAAFAFLILLIGWLREPQPTGGLLRSAPLLLAAAGLAVAPLGRILGSPRAFSTEFLPPGPRPATLGVLFAVGLPLTALAATWVRGPRRERYSDTGLALAVGVSALTATLVMTLRGLEYSTTASLLSGGKTLWFGLQAATVLLLTSAAALLLPGPVVRSMGREPPPRRAWFAYTAALVTAVTLGIAAHGQLEMARRIVPTAGVLWAVPFALLGIAFRDARVGPSGLARWLAAGVIAASAVLPQIWGGHTGARLQSAEEDLASLGAETPPIVDFMLLEFAREAKARHIAGESGVQLVYRSWVASGLAQEPYPVRVTLWSASGQVEAELNLGGAESSPDSREPMWEHIRVTHGPPRSDTAARVGVLTGLRDVSRILTAPLDSLHFLSATVAPRRELRREGILAPFLGDATPPDVKLNWVNLRGAELNVGRTAWARSPEGWRAEALVVYREGPQHAHLTLRVTPFWMRVSRATLFIAFDLALLALLWLGGHLAQGKHILPGEGVPWVHTLRARITLALFVFFIVPTAVLGWIAYRGLSSVVTEAATDMASRASQQAVAEWPQAEGDLAQLSAHADAEVLYYYRGELAEASGTEGWALGIHNAWMKPETYRLLESGDASAALEDSRIGNQDYITAYGTLQATGALAVPVGISAGVAARKQRDIAHLVLLAVVLGAMLSLALSVVVGRTLAGPIGLLQRAAAAVGAGRLSVELPEPKSDEFGQLFSSFNHMVRQLRWARAREVRSARVLAWGEMARQVAHEIKNPLTPIRLAVQHLRRAFRDGRSDFGKLLDENVDQVLTEIDRLNDISRAFSRYGAPPEEVGPLLAVDPAGVIREVLTLYRAGETGIDYVDRLDVPLPPVIARPDEVREVLLNLLENARDAVGDEGRVIITGSCADGFVEIEVSDSGPGIAEDLLPHIFEPHFSTRSSGTGLGLAVVRRLVEGWGGTVDASSAPGQGTSLRFRIPTAEGKPCGPESSPEDAEPLDEGPDPASANPTVS